MTMPKKCSKCGEILDEKMFYKSTQSPDGLQHYCIPCMQQYRGYTPVDKSVHSASYLGCHIAEPILLQIFKTATKMPTGNRDYDYICGKGYKIDVKSSTLRPKTKVWYFTISYNTDADYFMFIAFNNRIDLTVNHIWVVPQVVVGNTAGIAIGAGKLSQSRWKQYEIDIPEGVTNGR